MNNTPFPRNHWSRDWTLLVKIREDFRVLRDEFGLGHEPKSQQIDAIWEDALGDGTRFPSLRDIGRAILNDSVLTQSLRKSYRELDGHLRWMFPFDDILVSVKMRLILCIWRGAEQWLRTRRPLDTHWARFWNQRNLKQEILRTIQPILEARQNEVDLLSRDGMEDMSQTSLSFDRSQNRSPVQIQDDYPPGYWRLSPSEQKVYSAWYAKTGEGDFQSESSIAKSLGITLETMNKIIQRVQKLSRKPR